MKYLLKFLLSLTLPVLLLCSVEAEQLKPLPLDAYAVLPQTSMFCISPDGSRYAFRYNKDNKDLLVVKEVKTGKMLRLIDITEIDPKSALFVNNNQIVLKVSSYMGMIGYRGRHNISSAFIYDIDEQDIRQLLIPGYGIYRGQTQLGDIIGVNKKEQKLLMPAFFGDDNVQYAEPVYSLMQVNMNKKREPRRATKGTHDAIDFFVDEEGELLVQERYNNDSDLHRVQVRRNDEWVDIFSETVPIRKRSFVGLTPDRKNLVMLMYGEEGRSNYYTMSLADGKITGPLFANKNADVENVLTDIQRVVYGIQYSGFHPTYQFFEEKLQKTYQSIQQALPNHSFTVIDYTPDWKNILFLIQGPEVIGSYVLFANNEFQVLEVKRPEINIEDYNQIEITQYKARDGLTIPTLLTYPKNKSKEQLPTILLPHGGPRSYDRVEFDWIPQFFASRGYLVIQPQFRGSDGFGSAHINAGHGEWGGKMQDDLTDAVDHYIKTGLVNKDKVCIAGASYGGYAALAGGAFTPNKYRCVISINGVSDLEEMLDTEKYNYGSDHWVVSYWEKSLLNKKDPDEFLESISPINFAKQFKAPVLLIHSERDKVVPYEQSDDMFDELEDAGKNVKLVELEEDGHNLIYAKSRLLMLKEIDAFLNKYM
ncbi:prolyl oligopeptidase family serine peptidase [Catenovulum sp. 2E275]|uniref:alpha/beta hydrolase family protein n=1 Tax=Catenovulum sp. 2E275 TaxID=2980497 RepID=UPI0021CF05C9|nr:prolyl oligopeptidase family serine peptidase [Catenovulum sp. 2E275]MCU4675050.1 prolyl oligopeptidase family serine peptidase [Catenovulum sp. 2E275]